MTPTFQQNGTIHRIEPEKQVSEKFRTREFVLHVYDPNYPQKPSFTVINANCDLLNKYATGDEVCVWFTLKGREWNGPNGVKYFNTLECFKITGQNAE